MPAGPCGNLSALLPLAGIVLVAAPALPAPAGVDAPAYAPPPGASPRVAHAPAASRIDDGDAYGPPPGASPRAAPPDRVPAAHAPAASRIDGDAPAAPPGASPRVAHAPAASRVDDGDAPAATVAAVDTVVLRVDGLDADVLRAALARRRPDLTLRGPADVRDDRVAPIDASRAAYVEVFAALPVVRLDVVLGDGRAYHRELDTGGAPGERSAARMLVQLLAAIAEQRAEPERRDAPIPAWVTAPDPAIADADVPTAIPGPPAAIVEPTTTIPEPPAAVTVPAPRPAPTRPAEPTARPPAPVVADRRGLELGLAGDFTALLGLSPPRDVSPLRGLGGGLRLDLAWPRALVVGLGVRALQRRADDLALTRLRGAATVGWLARRGRFEALLSAGLSFETWRLRQQGEPVYYAEPGADTRPLLIGGLVRAAPGVRLTTRGRVAVRLGAFLELAGSVLPTGAAARLSRIYHDGRPPAPRFAAGGVELAMGLELAVWISLRRPRA